LIVKESTMSRAFTREIDDAPPPPPAGRPISSALNLVTPRGALLITAALAEAAARISQAPDRDTLAVLRRDQRYWSSRHASMQIVKPAPASDGFGFGMRIVIRRRGQVTEFTSVGEDEADPAAGRIAWTAPLARALEGALAGDMIDFEAGGQTEVLHVISVHTDEAAS
jgi:transcription elongation GreA/GreB family factor